jgi:hypothetical protein
LEAPAKPAPCLIEAALVNVVDVIHNWQSREGRIAAVKHRLINLSQKEISASASREGGGGGNKRRGRKEKGACQKMNCHDTETHSLSRKKVKSKADIKAKNIQNAVTPIRPLPPRSELSIRQAATLFHCSKSSVANHINEKEIQYLPDLAVDRQKLTSVEEAALKDHIDDCYKSGMPISPGLQTC